MSEKTHTESDMSKMLGTDRASRHGRRLKRWLVIVLVIVAVVVVMAVRKGSGKSGAPQYKTQEARQGSLVVRRHRHRHPRADQPGRGGQRNFGHRQGRRGRLQRQGQGRPGPGPDGHLQVEAQEANSRPPWIRPRPRSSRPRRRSAKPTRKLAQLQRVRELSGGKVPSQNDLDAAQAAFERAQADEASTTASVAQAQATLDATQTDIAKATIRSPIDGDRPDPQRSSRARPWPPPFRPRCSSPWPRT